MICSVCPRELTDRQERRYHEKHGKKKFLKPPPTCSVECSAVRKQMPKKSKRKETWAQRESGWDGKTTGGSW